MKRLAAVRGACLGIAVAALIVGLVGAPAQASPIIIMDVRLQDGSHSIQVDHVGQVVTTNLYFLILDTKSGTANYEAFTATAGAIMSSKGGILGDLMFDPGGTIGDPVGAWGPPVDDSVSSPGYDEVIYKALYRQDLDADGDLDLGTLKTDTNGGHYFAAAGLGMKYKPSEGSEMIGGSKYQRYLIAEGVEFTVASGKPGDSTTVNYVGRGGNNSQKGYSDAVYKSIDPESTSQYAVGDGVAISYVPEPATLALLGLGAVAALARRRR